MIVYVDTSALYAVLDRDDGNHERAGAVWRSLVQGGERLITSSYVVVECAALVQRRLGMTAVRTLLDDVLAVTEICFVSEEVHAAATAAFIIANRRDLSFVDCVSFEVMRRLGIGAAFAFDAHFEEQGFSRA
jgi:predicted nucleic acid-binding protein